MGIKRLTQDFRPYQKTAILSRRKRDGDEIQLSKVVIDGPSMVYHVYHKLDAFKSAKNASRSVENLPSYVELNMALTCFLTDLETCGATIQHIFFDGALSVSKRPTRLHRLEKARVQLQVQRLSTSTWTLKTSSTSSLTQADVSQALWHGTGATNVPQTKLVPPFIVPAAVEHLLNSNWADKVDVVPGEAEAFCAPAARIACAAVLTNDSDLVLYEDVSEGGTVGLLHSLSMTFEHGEQVLSVQCWQPREIAARLGLPSLTSLGYERYRDSSASLSVIQQRAKVNRDSPGFTKFTAQFARDVASFDNSKLTLSTVLNGFDPRLAELLCQLQDFQPSDSSQNSFDLQVTLPILLEDPTRDASWAHGKLLRMLTYKLLRHVFNQCKRIDKIDQTPTDRYQTPSSVTEVFRKGQRIVREQASVVFTSDQLEDVFESLQTLKQLSAVSTQPLSATAVAAGLTGWALRIVLDRRLSMGKSYFSRSLLELYLGIINPGQPPSHDDANGWMLLHLNANVQATLYSLRMLRQVVSFILKYGVDVDIIQPHMHVIQLVEHAGAVPLLQDLFLNISDTRALFQSLSQAQMAEVKELVFGSETDDVQSPQLAVSRPRDAGPTGILDFEQPKKRKRARVRGQNEFARDLQTSASKNPFDALSEQYDRDGHS